MYQSTSTRIDTKGKGKAIATPNEYPTVSGLPLSMNCLSVQAFQPPSAPSKMPTRRSTDPVYLPIAGYETSAARTTAYSAAPSWDLPQALNPPARRPPSPLQEVIEPSHVDDSDDQFRSFGAVFSQPIPVCATSSGSSSSTSSSSTSYRAPAVPNGEAQSMPAPRTTSKVPTVADNITAHKTLGPFLAAAIQPEQASQSQTYNASQSSKPAYVEPVYNDSTNIPFNQSSVPSSDGVNDFLLSALEGDSDEEGGRVRVAPLQADAETLKSRKICGMPRTRNAQPALTTTSVEKLPLTNTTTSTTTQTHPATAPVSPPLERPESPWSPLRSLSSLPPDQPPHTPRCSSKDRKTDDVVEVHESSTVDHPASFSPPSLGQSSRLEDLAAVAATISTTLQAKDTSHLPSPQPLTPVEAYSMLLGRAKVSVECPQPIFSSTGYYPHPHTPSPQSDAAVVDMTINNATWEQESDHELMSLDEDAPPSSDPLPTQAPTFDMDMDRDIPVDISIISDDNMQPPFTTGSEQVAPGDDATRAWSQDATIDAADHMTDDYHYQQAGTSYLAAAPAPFTNDYLTPNAVLMDNFASGSAPASTEPAGHYYYLPPRPYPQYGYLTRAAESLQLRWLGGIFNLRQEDLTETFNGLAAWFSSQEYLTQARERGYLEESAEILALQCLAQNNILYDTQSYQWYTWLPNEQTFTGTAAADSPVSPTPPLNNMPSPTQHTYPLHSESYPQAAQPFTTPDDEDPAAFLGSPPLPPSPISTMDPVPLLELPRTDFQVDTTPPSPPQTPAATQPSTPVPTTATVDIQPSEDEDPSSTPLKDSTDNAAFAPLTPPSSPEAATEPKSPTMSSSTVYSSESPVPCPNKPQGSAETTENKVSPVDELRQQEVDETKITSADNTLGETDENTEGKTGVASKTSGVRSTIGSSHLKIGLLVALWHLSKRQRKPDAPSDAPAPASDPEVPLSSDTSPTEPPVQADPQPPAPEPATVSYARRRTQATDQEDAGVWERLDRKGILVGRC